MRTRLECKPTLFDSYINPKITKFVEMQQPKAQQVLAFSNSGGGDSSSDKKLCIEIGSHFYSFCISDLSGKQVYDFACIDSGKPIEATDILSLFDHPKLVSTSFVDVVLVHNCREIALVPAVLHQPDANLTILQAIHGDISEWKVMEDDVHQWELFTIYGWNSSLVSVVAERYPQVRFIQFTTGALRSLFKSISIEKEQVIKLYFYQKEIITVVLKDSQLQLAQTFVFETPQDVIYHLLNIVERLKLDLATVIVEVSGLIDIHSETWSELNKFFVEVELDEPSNFTPNKNEDDALPAHYYTPFLISPRCV